MDSIDNKMQRTVKSKELKGKVGDSEVESESRGISSENSVKKEKCGGLVHLDLEEKSKSNFTSGKNFGERGKGWSSLDLDSGKDNGCDMLFDSGVVSEGDSSRDQGQNDEVGSSVQLKGYDGKITDFDELDVELKSQDTYDACNRKRKLMCFSKSLNWARRVANDPCNKFYGSLPETSKWEQFGTDYPWKLILLHRQAMMVERNGDSSFVQSIWQKRQKMLPIMYEDHSATKRCSQRICSAKTSQAVKKSQAQHYMQSTSSNAKSGLEDPPSGFWLNEDSESIITIDENAQAEIPEWTENVSDSDSKWLGKCIWPQKTGVDRHCLMEWDAAGSGRRDMCSCENKGSLECVRLHVSEERSRLKRELGMAFYQMQIDKMGEEVALSWNKAEELNFEAIVKSNPLPVQKKKSNPSSRNDKGFWKKLLAYFHYKTSEQLVSYYFNVFLLRRRSLQNRSTAVEISSDDDT